MNLAHTWAGTMASYLSDLGAEAAVDFYNECYVTIPTGGTGEAIEIEKLGRYIWVVYVRTWDRTNGLADERLVVESQSCVAIHKAVRETFAKIQTELDKLEALLSASDGG